jgi:hypothetical protein
MTNKYTKIFFGNQLAAEILYFSDIHSIAVIGVKPEQDFNACDPYGKYNKLRNVCVA